jgi:cell division protease FtsH
MALVPDQTIVDIIYKEGVFPTQGARPILSTFNTLADAYVARLVNDIIFQNPETNRVEWTYVGGDDPEYVFKAIAPDKTIDLRYPVKLTLENLRKSDFSESQASCAVHEAGHAVICIMKLKLIPQEVKSRTASVAEGYCYCPMPDIDTKDLLFGHIMYCLGGLEAEKLIFGEENMSSGGGSDLKTATTSAASMVKTLGMADHMHQVSVPGANPNSVYNEDSNFAAEKWAIELVHKAQEETKKCLEDNVELLMEIAHHLSIYPAINQEDLQKMAEKYTSDIRTKDKYYGFKDMIKQKMLALGMEFTEIPEEQIKTTTG